jgi:hypothetical protein
MGIVPAWVSHISDVAFPVSKHFLIYGQDVKLIMICLRYILYRYGARIRKKSHFSDEALG